MASRARPLTPHRGDLVAAAGENVTAPDAMFVVSQVDTPRTTVDLKLVNDPNTVLTDVPWSSLIYRYDAL